MASNRRFDFGPVALTATLTTNIWNVALTSVAGPVGFTATQPFALLTKLMVLNKTAGAVTFSLWKGATGANTAGTEFIGTAISVPANSNVVYYLNSRFASTDFLVGGASAGTSLTIQGEFELGFS
jgi:hypothetical protein